MKKDDLLQYLLKSMSLLKEIKKRNIETNEMIDTLMSEILESISKKEEEKGGGGDDKSNDKKKGQGEGKDAHKQLSGDEGGGSGEKSEGDLDLLEKYKYLKNILEMADMADSSDSSVADAKEKVSKEIDKIEKTKKEKKPKGNKFVQMTGEEPIKKIKLGKPGKHGRETVEGGGTSFALGGGSGTEGGSGIPDTVVNVPEPEEISGGGSSRVWCPVCNDYHDKPH